MLLQDWIAQYELKTKEKFKRDKRFELFSCQKRILRSWAAQRYADN